jgi:sorbitol-specific phosphotransferase system component IIBC
MLNFFKSFFTSSINLFNIYNHVILSLILFMCCIFFIYCAGLGTFMEFMKVLAVHQIFHTWIYCLHHLPLCSPHSIPGIVSTDIIFAFIYMCISFAVYSPSYTLSSLPPPHTGNDSPTIGHVPSSCSPIL